MLHPIFIGVCAHVHIYSIFLMNLYCHDLEYLAGDNLEIQGQLFSDTCNVQLGSLCIPISYKYLIIWSSLIFGFGKPFVVVISSNSSNYWVGVASPLFFWISVRYEERCSLVSIYFLVLHYIICRSLCALLSCDCSIKSHSFSCVNVAMNRWLYCVVGVLFVSCMLTY